ncbi:MAG TPA: glycosyltransferase family 9 protein [Chitinophagaceae bacterium]|nr:glycosyltransferase family 9 protein [Chitinophagaceae bacterium]
MNVINNKKVGYLAHHALGDVIMKLPAIRWLCETAGTTNVYLTVQRAYLADLLSLELNIPIENMLVYGGLNTTWKDKLRFLVHWRSIPIDTLILPATINYNLGKQLFRLSKAKELYTSSKLVQYTNKPGTYYSKFKHKVFLNAEFVRLFEKDMTDETFIQKVYDSYYLDKEKYPCGKTVLLQKTGKDIAQYIIVHLGSGDSQKHKRIPMHHAQKIVEFIINHHPGLDIILTGSGNESELIEELCNKIDSPKLLNVVDKFSLPEFIGVIASASLFISGDCGPVHLASILKVPIITFFGPTNFDITGPFTNASVFTHLPLLNCMPCHDYSKRAENYGCPPIYCLNGMNITPALLEVQRILTTTNEFYYKNGYE